MSIRDDGDEPKFNFPKEMKLENRLKDILETEVDEKYYLSQTVVICAYTPTERGAIYKGKEIKEGDGLYLQTTQEFFRGGLSGVSRALKSECCDAGVCQGYRIRKLTERECFRLMDVPEEYIDIIQKSGVSRSQQYKMAGNSIVVNVLYHIFRKAFIETENENSQLTLF